MTTIILKRSDTYHRFQESVYHISEEQSFYSSRSYKGLGLAIESMARIPLPFAVETHIYDNQNLSWCDNGMKLIYVRLKSTVEQYALQNDKDLFDIQ